MQCFGAKPEAMKESILDVLLYLFEHYFAADEMLPLESARTTRQVQITEELAAAGFSSGEIGRAFSWLDALVSQRGNAEAAPVRGPTRVFNGVELAKLDVESRGFLLSLEQRGVLDVAQRELVLDRALALDQDTLELDDLKWVVLMVLFDQPGAEAAYAWMETQMDSDDPEPLH